MIERINQTTRFLKNNGITNTELGIVLGTGLGKLVEHIEVELEIPYSDIPNFPLSTVESHAGKLIYGKLKGKHVLAMQGRFHLYEGYSLQEITFPIRVMKKLGVKNLLLSNACGSMNPSFKKGSLMMIDDHINLLPGSPLIGKNLDELGSRFPDMSEPYSSSLNNKLQASAKEINMELNKGVYVAVTGPQLETRAEYRYLRTIGADVVGMSTVPEVIVANHMNLRCAAISVITDECDPDNLKPVSIEEIIKIAGEAELKLIQLILRFVDMI